MPSVTKNLLTITMSGFRTSYMDEVLDKILKVTKEYPELEVSTCNSFIRLEQRGE